MKRLFIFGVCALVVLCMASCYPEGPDYVHEKDIALTHYDEKADFSTLKTFVIPDSVVYVQGDSNATGLANELKEEILSLVKQNFEAYNYQLLTDEEAEAQTPDFVVTVTAFATPTFSYNSWGNYWGWYPGWLRSPAPPQAHGKTASAFPDPTGNAGRCCTSGSKTR